MFLPRGQTPALSVGSPAYRTGFPEVRWGEASEGFGAGLTDGGQLVGATASQIPAPRE